LFPTFADDQTQKRFRAPRSSTSPAQLKRRRDEADEAVWWLGTRLTVQVIAGSGDSILHVLAGEESIVIEQGQQLCEQVWSHPLPKRASLVVAGIGGGPDQQTWENFARALSAALRAVDDDGTVVICSELNGLPGPALRRLGNAASPEAARRAICQDHTADALPAWQLAAARDRVRVCLLSQLDEDVVEDLGVTPVGREDEIARLGRQHQSCILLANAQRVVPTPPE
jgi:nickel-dependent lactate racemase